MVSRPSRAEVRAAETKRELRRAAHDGRSAKRKKPGGHQPAVGSGSPYLPPYSTEREGDDWPASEHALYMPPWREALGKELGPEYGPRTQGAFDRQVTSFEQSTAGGGLWDPEEAERMNMTAEQQQARNARREEERHDAEKMRRFVERYRDQVHHEGRIKPLADVPQADRGTRRAPPVLSNREVEVYVMFYVDRMSKGAIGRHLGTSKQTVSNQLLGLKKKMKTIRGGR